MFVVRREYERRIFVVVVFVNWCVFVDVFFYLVVIVIDVVVLNIGFFWDELFGL